MAEHSKIEWTDATWNPITGCSVVSPGCTNCYAMRLAGTRLQHHPSRAGLTTDTKAGPVWNGKVRLNEDWLTLPLRWKRPRRIFVCAHGDLFHENVPDEWIDKVFAIMALAARHQFQVLTKRSARMQRYLTHAKGRVGEIVFTNLMRWQGLAPPLRAEDWRKNDDRPWPLPNVWLGISAEDQRRADERIDDLLATPAAVRFVSAEPLLGPVDLTRHFHSPIDFADALHWVIVGGESGPGARPMHPAWARDLMRQCSDAGVPFFFKQWGDFLPDDQTSADCPYGTHFGDTPTGRFADNMAYCGVGKRRAGRLLDEREHNGMPEVRT